jgi:hypothetical protein
MYKNINLGLRLLLNLSESDTDTKKLAIWEKVIKNPEEVR